MEYVFFCDRVLSPFGFRSTVPSPTQILEAASEGTNRSSFRARTTSTSTGGVCIRFVSGPENLVPKNFLFELAFFPLEVDLLTWLLHQNIVNVNRYHVDRDKKHTSSLGPSSHLPRFLSISACPLIFNSSTSARPFPLPSPSDLPPFLSSVLRPLPLTSESTVGARVESLDFDRDLDLDRLSRLSRGGRTSLSRRLRSRSFILLGGVRLRLRLGLSRRRRGGGGLLLRLGLLLLPYPPPPPRRGGVRDKDRERDRERERGPGDSFLLLGGGLLLNRPPLLSLSLSFLSLSLSLRSRTGE